MANASQKLPTVDESVLKRRKLREVNEARHAKAALHNKKPQLPQQKIKFKRAEKYIKEVRLRQKDNVRLARKSSWHRHVDESSYEAKLAVAVRIRSVKGANKRILQTLKLLRLQRLNTCIFLKMNKTTLNMLQIVEPYVTWGIPSLKTIRELIFKHGYGMAEGKRMPLTDNAYIEKHLGQYDIICLEDVIHELVTLGPRFKEVCTYLLHFKLHSPAGGWKKRAKRYVDGGECGDRAESINELLQRMI